MAASERQRPAELLGQVDLHLVELRAHVIADIGGRQIGRTEVPGEERGTEIVHQRHHGGLRGERVPSSPLPAPAKKRLVGGAQLLDDIDEGEGFGIGPGR